MPPVTQPGMNTGEGLRPPGCHGDRIGALSAPHPRKPGEQRGCTAGLITAGWLVKQSMQVQILPGGI